MIRCHPHSPQNNVKTSGPRPHKNVPNSSTLPPFLMEVVAPSIFNTPFPLKMFLTPSLSIEMSKSSGKLSKNNDFAKKCHKNADFFRKFLLGPPLDLDLAELLKV